ncbi:MAG: hypothetical protein E7379_04025 [Clostridiales bacterium]|nr:hypothetical protein [Clostridiales bacterium]
MFFWKFTRSGKYSNKYISLIIDIHESSIADNNLYLSYEECKNLLILIQDVEKLNGLENSTAGLLKSPYRSVIKKLSFEPTDTYQELRHNNHLVLNKMILGNHIGTPLDYGKDIHTEKELYLDIQNLQIQMFIDAKTGIIYGNEDKLKAYRSEPEFVFTGKYFDLMPKHNCIIEIVTKMIKYNKIQTEKFLIEILKWKKL